MASDIQNFVRSEFHSTYRLAVFDMDGVLINYSSSWAWINKMLGIDNSHDLKAYLNKEINEERFMKRDIARWRNMDADMTWDDVAKLMESVPLIQGIRETVFKLHWYGIKCVIVSGGLIAAAARIAKNFEFDGYIANDLDRDVNGILTGDGLSNVDLEDKGPWVNKFQSEFNVPKAETFSIGNSFSDLPMFRESGFGIAFNPIDDKIIEGADAVVKSENIADILPYVLKSKSSSQL